MINRPKVWQDPGHGGPDPGCCANGVFEKVWTYYFSLDAASAIQPLCFDQAISREADTDPTLQERAEEAQIWGADLAILHHVNSNEDEAVDGMMAFAMPQDGVAIDVGSAIIRASPLGLIRRHREVTIATPEAWPRVCNCLRPYWQRQIPAVLIEWGFASSAWDAKILLHDGSRPALCSALFSGIARALELKNV